MFFITERNRFSRKHSMKEEQTTTIKLKKSVIEELKRLKKNPWETYSEVISGLLEKVKEPKKRREYDKFIHRVQQVKMKELWDNAEDEALEQI